jgi:hypothetical protein
MNQEIIMLNRRTLLSLALTGAASTAIGGFSPAMAAPAIRVDVSELVSRGAGANAARIKAALERELAGTLGPSLNGNGTSLIVTVHSLSMPSYAGSGSGIGGGSALDGLDTTATLLGRDGRVIASYPVQSSSSASMAGPWYAPDIDARRIDSLVHTNAGWIRRYVAG